MRLSEDCNYHFQGLDYLKIIPHQSIKLLKGQYDRVKEELARSLKLVNFSPEAERIMSEESRNQFRNLGFLFGITK